MPDLVSRQTVIRALRANGVDVSLDEDAECEGMFVLAKGEMVEVVSIPLEVGNRMLQRFCRTYGVPIHQFYNPLMIPNESDESIQ